MTLTQSLCASIYSSWKCVVMDIIPYFTKSNTQFFSFFYKYETSCALHSMASYSCCRSGDSHDAGMLTCGPRHACFHKLQGIMLTYCCYTCWYCQTNETTGSKETAKSLGEDEHISKLIRWLCASSKTNIQAPIFQKVPTDLEQNCLTFSDISLTEEKTKPRLSQIRKS